ncbi:DUF6398 domain-containing protein [Methanogenium sp. MK-MG]|uniref:DUF6398 domain-containing protein n=1 Tax=Methanogenium sp. MK-MG TaxID=2599926 RepID=UPI0013EE30E3|nr:DUF6398 domain-containing protein [Methanogenium sp. MK-MG]KAF1073707.1 hypothetical protein MKMG_02093 [Methanogenium sp. MK-MG]
MIPRKRPGTCLLCRTAVGKKGARRHLDDCLSSSGWPEGLSPSYIIRIDGRRDPSSWMFVLAKHDAQFSDLDHLLRDVWMGGDDEDEYSSFIIGGVTYVDVETDKKIPLVNRIEEGQLFYYAYDIGAPTEVRLKVVATTSVMPPEGPCCLIARNLHVLPECCICGDDAEFRAVDPDDFISGEDDDAGQHYCRDCLRHFDSALIRPIANSPRTEACFRLDDMEAALNWYPPGWEMSDLISDNMREVMEFAQELPDDHVSLSELFSTDDDVVAMEQAARADVGDEIDGFLAEEAAHGEDVNLSEEIVSAFCIILYGIYETGIEDWDAALLRRILVEDMVGNPHATDEWAEHFVPVCCRFLAYAETVGRDVNAAALITALREAEPEFLMEVEDSPYLPDVDDLIGDGGLAEPGSGVDNAVSDLIFSAMSEIISRGDRDVDSDKLRSFIEDSLKEMRAHNIMIVEGCEEFCVRMDNESMAERCREIVSDLFFHPDVPLTQGSAPLCSGAIVYVACQEEGCAGQSGEWSAMEREICEYFNIRLLSLLSQASVVKKCLAEGPDTD